MTKDMKKIDQAKFDYLDRLLKPINSRLKLGSKYAGASGVAWLASVQAWADGGPALPAGTSALTGGVAPGVGSFSQPGGIMAYAPFVLMFAVVYFLMIRPQQKKAKEQQEMLNALKHGDEVITASGLLGKVTGITEKVVTVEVADDVRVKMLKSQVSQVIKGSIKDVANL